MANYVYIAASLDGFIATKDGGIDWLSDLPNPDQSDFGYAQFMDGIDAVVMGRNSFEKVLTFGEWHYTKPLFVLSRTLTEVPDHLTDKVEIICESIPELVRNLNQRGFVNLYIDGGTVIQSFLKDDLIDEMIITTVPILLGDGIPLFGRLDKSLSFRHVNTIVYGNGLVKYCCLRDR